MADNSEQENAQNESQQQQQPPQQNTALGYIMSNKVEAGLWMSRVFTVVSSILFLLPFFGGSPYTHYQRALISNAVTSALRLHQRLPNFQFSRAFMTLLFAEDSCHYLLFSVIFLNSQAITMVLVPIFLFALLHACKYTKNLLNLMGPSSLMVFRNLIAKLEAQQVSLLRFISCSEIFLMPTLIVMAFSGKSSIFHPFVYYRFLTLRYASRRNPYCRTLFYELRMTVDYVCNKPSCPQFVRNIAVKSIGIISRLAPQVVQ